MENFEIEVNPEIELWAEISNIYLGAPETSMEPAEGPEYDVTFYIYIDGLACEIVKNDKLYNNYEDKIDEMVVDRIIDYRDGYYE